MSQYVAHNLIDQQIVDEMANQAPAPEKRLRAINAELRNLQTKYSLETFRRKKSVEITSDGAPYLISDIISDDDVMQVRGIRITEPGIIFPPLVPVDSEVLMDDIAFGRRVNKFSCYYEDGKMYLRVLTDDVSDEERSFEIIYDTTNLAIDASGNYFSELASGSGMFALVPSNHLDLVALGAMKRLFYQAIGEQDGTQSAIVRNRYEGELKKLGLSTVSKAPVRNTRKIKLRKMW